MNVSHETSYSLESEKRVMASSICGKGKNGYGSILRGMWENLSLGGESSSMLACKAVRMRHGAHLWDLLK